MFLCEMYNIYIFIFYMVVGEVFMLYFLFFKKNFCCIYFIIVFIYIGEILVMSLFIKIILI